MLQVLAVIYFSSSKFKTFANENFKRCPSAFDFCRVSMLENLWIQIFICYLFYFRSSVWRLYQKITSSQFAWLGLILQMSRYLLLLFPFFVPPYSLLSENYCMIIVVNDIVPGLSSLVKLSVPDQRSNKVRIFLFFLYMRSLFFLSYAYICMD